MPDWYLVFVAAEALHERPWELAGFVYENPSVMPVCWREWALEFTFARAAAQAAKTSQSQPM